MLAPAPVRQAVTDNGNTLTVPWTMYFQQLTAKINELEKQVAALQKKVGV